MRKEKVFNFVSHKINGTNKELKKGCVIGYIDIDCINVTIEIENQRDHEIKFALFYTFHFQIEKGRYNDEEKLHENIEESDLNF
tara:strand:+ start:1421 stop:1672 length:252 start_codon:yes stop_codon:yes gene_type:complete